MAVCNLYIALECVLCFYCVYGGMFITKELSTSEAHMEHILFLLISLPLTLYNASPLVTAECPQTALRQICGNQMGCFTFHKHAYTHYKQTNKQTHHVGWIPIAAKP